MPAVPQDIPTDLIVREWGPKATWVWVWPHGWLRRRPEPSEGGSDSGTPPATVSEMVAFWHARWETLSDWQARCQRMEKWVFGSSDEETEETTVHEVLEVANAHPNSELTKYMGTYCVADAKIANWTRQREGRKNTVPAAAAPRSSCTPQKKEEEEEDDELTMKKQLAFANWCVVSAILNENKK